MFPEDLKYTKNHSWVKVEGENGRVGLTNYAQEQLSDIVTVELPHSCSTYIYSSTPTNVNTVVAAVSRFVGFSINRPV